MFFLIPVYNDWESLKVLLKKINSQLSKSRKKCNVLIVDDCSTILPKLSLKNLRYLKKIQILRIKKNSGSQQAIGLGLKHLNKTEKKSLVIVMDSDGEDDPKQINKMISFASKYPNYIITSNRTKRKESFLIRFLYKSHLLLTFILTFKWISFGNYTSLDSNNFKKLLKDKSIWFAYPAAVIKNCNIIRLYAARKKRFYGNSKLTIYKLFFHSLRIISVFHLRVLMTSLTYISLLQIFMYEEHKEIFYLCTIPLIILNLSTLIVRIWIKKINIDYNKNWIGLLKKVTN